MTAPPLLLIDAANVVGSRPDGWWRDRPGAARRLIDQLVARPPGLHVVVVLEGAARDGVPTGLSGPVEVRHAPGSGDDALVELAGPGALVVTADRELVARVQARGAEVAGPRWLLERLETRTSGHEARGRRSALR